MLADVSLSENSDLYWQMFVNMRFAIAWRPVQDFPRLSPHDNWEKAPNHLQP